MSEVAQVPQLRFPEFNGAWEGSNIENISTLIQSGLSRLLNDSDIGIPVIRSSNISDNSLNIDDIKYWHLIDPQGANTSNYLLVENDLLINFINSMAQIGKACLYKNLLNRKVIFTTNLMRIQFSDNTIPEFVFYFFCTENYRRQLKAITMPAVNQASFTKKDFNKLQVHLPPKPEQEKIAAFLTAVDNKIEQLSKKQELLGEYKKGLMQQIFSQAVRFKADDGSEFPDWEEKKLGDVSDCLDNRRQPLNGAERNQMKGDIPYYGANGIVDYVNDYIFDEELVLLAEDGGNFNDFSSKPIAQKISGKAWVNNHAHILKAKNIIATDFLFYSLVHKDIRRYIVGGSRAKLI